MAAHGGDLKEVIAGQFIRPAPDAEGKVTGVVFQPRFLQTLINLLENAADDDGKAEVRLLEFLQDGGYVFLIVEDGVAYLAGIGDNLLRLIYHAAHGNAADIDRIMPQGDAQEFLALWDMALFIVAYCLQHHYDIILAQAFGAATAM